MSDLWAVATAEANEPLTEPWQARAVALAVGTVTSLGLEWDDFRRELMAAIDDEPQRPYYESWIVALERLVASRDRAALDDLDAHRSRAASYRVGADLDVFPLALDDDAAAELIGPSAATAAHVELHRRANGTRRLCAFDSAGAVVVEVEVDLDAWNELRHRHLGLAPDPPDVTDR